MSEKLELQKASSITEAHRNAGAFVNSVNEDASRKIFVVSFNGGLITCVLLAPLKQYRAAFGVSAGGGVLKEGGLAFMRERLRAKESGFFLEDGNAALIRCSDGAELLMVAPQHLPMLGIDPSLIELQMGTQRFRIVDAHLQHASVVAADLKYESSL